MLNEHLQRAIDAIGDPPVLGRDAVLYSGSAQWENWTNHVPMAVVAAWSELGPDARAAVYLTAKAVTNYERMTPNVGAARIWTPLEARRTHKPRRDPQCRITSQPSPNSA